MIRLPQFSILVSVAVLCLLPTPALPGATGYRSGRQADDVNTKEIKIDVTETDVVKEEAVGDDGDKQMDATAIEDIEADVEEEEVVEKEEEIEEEEDEMIEAGDSEEPDEDGVADVEDDEEDNKEDDSGIPDSMDRCHKCLKASFKFKKEYYCLKCVKNGIIKENEESPVHCRKCRKRSYRTKNEEFCKSKCTVETAMELLEEDALEDILLEILGEDTTTTSTTTAAPPLGFLGNIFKFIVEKTTFGAAPSASGSSEE